MSTKQSESTSASAPPTREPTDTELATWCRTLASESGGMLVSDWQRMIEANVRRGAPPLVPPRHPAPPPAARPPARGEHVVHFELWNSSNVLVAEWDAVVWTVPELRDVLIFQGGEYIVQDRFLELEGKDTETAVLRVSAMIEVS